MQHGKPVVVTPEVGAAEIVREAKCGLIVLGDPQPLGEAIDRLMTDFGIGWQDGRKLAAGTSPGILNGAPWARKWRRYTMTLFEPENEARN